MTPELLAKHLDAIEATLRLGLAQVAAMRHALSEAPPPTPAKPAPIVPERCAWVDAEACAEQGGEWQSRATLADPTMKRCTACGFERSGLS